MAKRKTAAKKRTNKKSSGSKVVGYGVGLGALVAGLAGGYYLYGSKNFQKNRKKVKGWALKMKGEVLDNLEKMKEVDEKVYHSVVDNVSSKYKKLKNVNKKEVEEVVKDMKKHWNNIKKDLGKSSSVKPKRKTSKKAAKKSTKKTSKKKVSKKS